MKYNICFVSHYAYGALATLDTGHIGGVERQTSMMAKWFAKHDYNVSVLTWDEGQEDGAEIEGVTVFKMCRKNAGIKGIRFFWPKWTSLNAAMKRADADIYYQNCGGYETGQVAMWCRRHDRKFVYSVASDPDCDVTLPAMRTSRDRMFYRYGLKHANAVIVQTQRQGKMLQDGFGKKAIVIPMPCESMSSNPGVETGKLKSGKPRVLWVGRISKEKRFEWLLEIALKCPEISFDILGLANNDSEYSNLLIKRGSEIPNIKIHGRIPHSEMSAYYRRSTVLCCTSSYEGFPNTFLEAWSCGLPAVSTFDPDDLIVGHNLGWTARNVDELVKAINEAVNKPAKWHDISKAAKEYYLKNHTPDLCIERFARVFQEVYQSHSSRGKA
jgi:glycosyltransferase involved in cell wall biosynthesis